jgi:hypothetical protein
LTGNNNAYGITIKLNLMDACYSYLVADRERNRNEGKSGLKQKISLFDENNGLFSQIQLFHSRLLLSRSVTTYVKGT